VQNYDVVLQQFFYLSVNLITRLMLFYYKICNFTTVEENKCRLAFLCFVGQNW